MNYSAYNCGIVHCMHGKLTMKLTSCECDTVQNMKGNVKQGFNLW